MTQKTVINKDFDGSIRELTLKGLGIIDHPEGKVFFVAGAWPGDQGSYQVISEKKNYGFAKCIKLTTPSDKRVKPDCPHQGSEEGQCGGCAWMIVDYETQLQSKATMVKESLTRAGVIDDQFPIKPIIGSEKQFKYRNRAQLKTDGKKIGYLSASSHELVDVKKCAILNDKCQSTWNDLRGQLPNDDWIPTNDKPWSSIDIDENLTTADIRLNRRRPFMQANNSQNSKMQLWLESHLNKHTPGSIVLELFSGSGNFTQVIAKLKFASITVVESSKDAIERFKEKRLMKVTILMKDLFQKNILTELAESQSAATILVLDPPRAGFKEIDVLLAGLNKLQSIYFIACDLSAFTRDAKLLKTLGWQLDELQPLDQFPHTPHIELMAKFVKQS